MPVVRPEFGPTLPEIAGPHIRRLSRAGWIAVAAAIVLVVVLAFALRSATADPELEPVLVREPVAFTLGYPSQFERADPQGRESVRLVGRAGAPAMRFTVAPFTLDPGRGDPYAAVLGEVARRIVEMRRADPGFFYRGEGRARINDQPGHYVAYQTKLNGETVYGRRFLLIPGADPDNPMPPPRAGVDVTLLSARTPGVANVDLIENGPLKTPLRSLRFGTERP